MVRNVASLTSRTFDLLVVGGGVYGLALAYDAAQRGLDVALIERGDFGAGTSFNHARTIHGGLRYLQSLDFARSRESSLERRTLARIAPHAVSPLPFALPLSRSLLKGKLALRAAFALDRTLNLSRNQGVSPSCRLPAAYVLSKAAALDRFPGLSRRNLTGAAVWHDYITLEADRLTFAWALAAAEHKATLANYVDAAAPIVEGRRVIGVRAVDVVTGREIEVSARVTVNATGSGVDGLLTPLGLSSGVKFLKAMNLVTRRDAGEEALGGRSGPSGQGRYFFLVPYRGRALLSTWESSGVVAPGDLDVKESEVRQFIAGLNQAFPALDLTLNDVSFVHRGTVPATAGSNGSLSLAGHEQIFDHSRGDHSRGSERAVEGLFSVVGAKYTTARAVAERLADRVFAALGRPSVPCKTASVLLPGGDLSDRLTAIADARRAHDRQFPSDTIPHVIAAYGSKYEDVLGMALERPEWCTRLSESSPVIGGQLVWAVRHEMAVTLGDAVMRRTPLGAMGYPGDASAERAAEIVGSELGWSQERRRTEVAALRRTYEPLVMEP